MAQTNFTPILLYASSTPASIPSASNLTNSATGSEIAINIADKNLFFKDSGGTVNTVPIRQSSTSSNGWLSSTDWNTFNNKSNTNGTVTSVAALTIGTAGTDLSSTVANGTTTPVITLNVPTASAANRGALSAADWTTFNSKQTALVSGTSIKTVGGVSLLGSGDVGTIGVGYGGTGITSYAVGDLIYASATTTLSKLADVATGNALISGGVGVAPSWGKIGLTTHISGTLAVGNGGTGASSASITAFNNITGYTASGATGTTSTNLVFSTSPTLTTPKATTTIGVGNATPSASGAGVSFPATQSTSTDVNTLDDYEEGTWTPTVLGSTTAGTTTYTLQSGTYTKVGNMVYCQALISWSAVTGTGNLRFGGLPFTSNTTTTANHSVYFGVVDSMTTLSSLNILTGVLPANSSTITAYQTPAGGGSFADIAIDGAAFVCYGVTYRTA